MNYKENPSYQDKEERRLITLSSMDNLLKFHEVERNEKHNTLKFYAVFLGGGLTLVFGMAKFSFGIKAALLEFIAITVIILINFLAIKKLLSVRGASNNIYHEYGKRLRFLLNSHSSDLDARGKKEINFAFKKYIDEQKSGDYLPKHSADTYEIYGFYVMNIIFSLAYIIPLVDIFKYFDFINVTSKIYEQLIHIQSNHIILLLFILIQMVLTIGVWYIGKYIIKMHISNAPNIRK
jgi:hypothetical protein